MEKKDALIEQVRDILIRENDQISKHELYLRFINECNEAELTEEDFYKQILKPAHKSVDWDAIQKATEEGQRIEAQEARKQVEHENAVREAPALIERLIEVAFEDGVVEAAALETIFEKARTLDQDVSALVTRIDGLLHQKGFKSWPRANFDAPTLMAMLLSSDWYDGAHYPRPATPVPPVNPQGAQAADTPRIHHFSANKKTVKKGEDVILSWQVSGVKEVAISGLGYTNTINGSHTVMPQQSTVYKLTAGKIEQTISIEVESGSGFWKTFLITVLVVAALLAGWRFVSDYLITDHADETSVTNVDTAGTDEPVYRATPLRQLKNGAGNSGLAEEEARGIVKTIDGYYTTINRVPADYNEISYYFHFPVNNYYGTKKLNRGGLMKSLAAYYEGVVVYWNNRVEESSHFTRKKNDKYYITVDEVYSYRKAKSADTLVVLDLTESLVLDKDFKIVSANTLKKSTKSRTFMPLNAEKNHEAEVYDRER